MVGQLGRGLGALLLIGLTFGVGLDLSALTYVYLGTLLLWGVAATRVREPRT